jgi:hypothetical protein
MRMGCWAECAAMVMFAACALGTAPRATADDQRKTGAGSAAAIELAKKSPMVRSAHDFLLEQAERNKDGKLRKETLDALGNDATCVRHRAESTP